MKIIYKIIILIMLFMVIIIGVKFKNDKMSYISIGDGLSKGINYNNYKGMGYSDYLYNYLNKIKKVDFYTNEFSNENNRITDLIHDLNTNTSKNINNKKITIKNAIKNADIITLSIGTNEILYKYSNNITDGYMYSYIDECINDLDQLLEMITKLNNKKIYMIGLYNPYNDIKLDNFIIYTNQKIMEKCNKYKIIYIDTYNLFKNNKHLIYNQNNNYPNKDGYKLIASSIKNKLNLSK